MFDVAPRFSSPYDLGLAETVDHFSGDVVAGIATSANGCFNRRGFQAVRELYRDISGAPVAIMDDTGVDARPSFQKVCSSASKTKSTFARRDTRHPMIRRATASTIKARYTKPCEVATEAKIRPPQRIRPRCMKRTDALIQRSGRSVIAERLPDLPAAHNPLQASPTHPLLDCTAGDGSAFPRRLSPHFRGAVYAMVVLEDCAALFEQHRIPSRPTEKSR